jgi:hypothetical protein
MFYKLYFYLSRKIIANNFKPNIIFNVFIYYINKNRLGERTEFQFYKIFWNLLLVERS